MREGYSLSDIKAVTGNNGNNGFGGFGGDGWAWIIVLFLIFGWGRNGFGGNGGSGVDTNYVLTSDFSQLSKQISDSTNMLERRTDNIINGICTLGYDNLVQSNGINTNILTVGNNIQTAIQSCCCDVREGIAGVNYNLATNTCAITNAMNMNTRDIIDNQNANYQKLHEEIVANRIEDKNAQIQAQQNEINALRLASSQAQQNEYLLNQLRTGCPVNAQIVTANTPVPVQYIATGCGCNNGCGCGM